MTAASSSIPTLALGGILLLCLWGTAVGAEDIVVKVPYNNETHVVTCVPGVRAHCASRYPLGNTSTT